MVEDAVHAQPGEYRLLDGHFALGAFEHAASHRRILAFGIFSHDQEVDVTRAAVGQRRGNAGHQPRGPQVDVLVELAADLDQRSPYRFVVRHEVRRTHGAEVDGIVAANLLLPVLGHHRAVAYVVPAAPVEVIEGQRDAELAADLIEDAQPFRHDFSTDSVAGNHGNAMAAHWRAPWS